MVWPHMFPLELSIPIFFFALFMAMSTLWIVVYCIRSKQCSLYYMETEVNKNLVNNFNDIRRVNCLSENI